MRNRFLVGVCVAGLMTFGAVPAQASDWEAFSSAHLGSADVRLNGERFGIDQRARCQSEELGSATASRVEIDGIVEFGPGTTTCALNQQTGVATARATGSRFRLDALRSHGGPLIRMTGYVANCFTTENGSGASIAISGLTGVTIPSTIGANHRITIWSRTPGRPPLATVVFNEKIVSQPADGSITVNVMRVRLFPQSPMAPLQGDIVVGSVSCAPF